MTSGLSEDLTVYEISECSTDSWILQLKSSTFVELVVKILDKYT